MARAAKSMVKTGVPEAGEVASWPVRQLSWDQLGQGAWDLRDLLDPPAGRHGRVRAREGQLRAEDGTRVRLFGCNLVFGAGFPPCEDAATLAERLARAGFNLVRMHHADSAHGMGYFDYRHAGPDGLPLDPEGMARFDRLFAELKGRGIYLHLDLYTLRTFLAEEGLGGLPQGIKHVPLYAEALQRVQDLTVGRLLTHVNPHTGMSLAQDPAVLVVQLVNEQSAQWWDAPPPEPWAGELATRWQRWLRHRYGSRQALAQAWGDGPGALGEAEDPWEGRLALPPLGRWHEVVEREPIPRRRDARLFLWELECAFARHGADQLRARGYQGAINLSNLPGGIAGLYALACPEAGMDLVEDNSYWDHPQGGFRPPVRHHLRSMVHADPRAGDGPFALHVIADLATHRAHGLPFVVTETYQATANPWRAELPLWLAAYACLQDWDGVMLFSYSHASVEEQKGRAQLRGSFDCWNDPSVWDMVPACALLFARGDVAAARSLSVLRVRDPFAGADGTVTGVAWAQVLRAEAFVHRVGVAFEDVPEAERQIPLGTPAPDPGPQLDSDTGELRWNRSAGLLCGVTPRSVMAVGWFDGTPQDLGPVRLRVRSSFAAVLVQSRDGLPLERTRWCMITAVARSANEDAVWEQDTLRDEGHGPVHAEPVRGDVLLPWGQMVPLDGAAHREVRR